MVLMFRHDNVPIYFTGCKELHEFLGKKCFCLQNTICAHVVWSMIHRSRTLNTSEATGLEGLNDFWKHCTFKEFKVIFKKTSCYHAVGGKCFPYLLSRILSRLIANFSEDSRGLVQATQKADKQYQSHTGLVPVHPSHFLHNSSSSHLHAAEHLVTYLTSLVCGWDRCCCRRPLQSEF